MEAELPQDMLSHALAYAKRGWLVLPLHNPILRLDKLICSCSLGDKCTSPAKHPRTESGLKDATIDELQIRRWWTMWPQANIGLATGLASGVIAVDIDGVYGQQSLEVLQQEYGTLPETLRQRTPREGGEHYLFKFDPLHPVANTQPPGPVLGDKIDTRGNGGYIVVAPSRVPSGRQYEWLNDFEVAEMPRWIYGVIEANRDAKKKPKAIPPAERTVTESGPYWLGKALAIVGVGNRNNTGFWLACQLRDARLSESEATPIIQDFCARCPRGDKEYSVDEAMASLREAFSQSPREPTDFEKRRLESKKRDRTRAPSTRKNGHPDVETGDNGHPEVIEPPEHAHPGDASEEEDNRPEIFVSTDEHTVADGTVEAIEGDPELYHRAGALVHVVNAAERSKRKGIIGDPTIIEASPLWVRERINRRAKLMQKIKTKEGWKDVRTHVPVWLPGMILARGEWPNVRGLRAISDAPVLRADGSLHQIAGYDEQTGVLYVPSQEFPAIGEVDMDDASIAVDKLLELVSDFPFELSEHRSAWLASLLTPLARFAFDGPSPAFLTDGNVRGSGKGLSCQVAALIIMGREMPVSGYSADPVEMAKKITAIALAGRSMVLLDNVTGTFGNDAIDRALTATRWEDRILGYSETKEVPLYTTWYATGNNFTIAADAARRAIHIRLDSQEERPEERNNFKIPKIRSHILKSRPQLLSYALTILMAYFRAGAPKKEKLSAFGSFEGWSDLIRNALIWIGQVDPCNTRANMMELSDETGIQLRDLVKAWDQFDHHGIGMTCADLINRLYNPRLRSEGDIDIAMRAAVEAITKTGPGKTPTARMIGSKLKQFRRRVVGILKFDVDPKKDDSAGATWKLFPKTYVPEIAVEADSTIPD